MKRGVLAALLAALMLMGALMFPSDSRAETGSTSTPTRTLSVSGQGRLEVKPDTATISLGITHVMPTPKEAYNAMSAELQKISGTVKAAGVKEEQIETGVFSLHPEYKWTQEKGQELVGYRATTSLNITTQQLDKVAELFQLAVEAGANQVNGVSFSVKDTDALMQQALDLAVDDAKAKAERVANRLGAAVVRVQSISIHDNGVPIFSRSMADGMAGMAKAEMAPAPVFGGTSSFSVSVSVVFEIQ
ncbi:MAG: SIMPL domain-containing protein [Bacillota bacterium]